jgi:hypothetical protein
VPAGVQDPSFQKIEQLRFQVEWTRKGEPERLGNRRDDGFRQIDRSQRDKVDSAGIFIALTQGEFDPQPRLADAAHACQGEQAALGFVEDAFHCREFGVASQKRGGR